MSFTRTCIACRKKGDKYSFIRVVSESGEAIIDTDCKKNSRGMYICHDKKCLDKVLKSKNINKVIKNGINVDSLKDCLKKVIVEMEDM